MDPNTAALKAHDIDIDALQAVPAETFLFGDDSSPVAWSSPDGWRYDYDLFPMPHREFAAGTYAYSYRPGSGGAAVIDFPPRTRG